MEMSKERRNEIAYLVLKEKVRDEGLHLNVKASDISRKLGNVAKKTGVSKSELITAMRNLHKTLFEDAEQEMIRAAQLKD
jgi:phage-related protein